MREKKPLYCPQKLDVANIMRLILLVARLMITETLLSFLSTGGSYAVRNEIDRVTDQFSLHRRTFCLYSTYPAGVELFFKTLSARS